MRGLTLNVLMETQLNLIFARLSYLQKVAAQVLYAITSKAPTALTLIIPEAALLRLVWPNLIFLSDIP